MKKFLSALFSLFLVGFLVMANGAIAEDVPESSSNEEAMFGSQLEGNTAAEISEDSQMLTHTLIESTETPEMETQFQEDTSSLPESSKELETADMSLN